MFIIVHLYHIFACRVLAFADDECIVLNKPLGGRDISFLLL